MNFMKILVPVLGLAALVVAWQKYGGMGVAAVAGALVMWGLLHFNRMVHVLRKAQSRPKGYVGSAVMLNAKLKPGVNLLHVMAMTNSLGEQLSPPGEDPEIYRWTDGGGSSVTCEFVKGKLVQWSLDRPAAQESAEAAP